jgi:hypothetical protein
MFGADDGPDLRHDSGFVAPRNVLRLEGHSEDWRRKSQGKSQGHGFRSRDVPGKRRLVYLTNRSYGAESAVHHP